MKNIKIKWFLKSNSIENQLKILLLITKGVSQRNKSCFDQNQMLFKKINFLKNFVWKIRKCAMKLKKIYQIATLLEWFLESKMDFCLNESSN